MSNSDPLSFGIMIVAALGGLAAVLLGAAVSAKALFSRPVDPSKEWVTRSELQAAVSELECKIDMWKSELVARLSRQDDYARQIAHEHAGILQSISLKVERLCVIEEIGRSPSPHHAKEITNVRKFENE